ncbi:MAG: site-specific DNA-methyltransferase [Deltaproteobacteria bacterium]|nr:site-specific DNA-methyltransferase [Deltaproteobacteria bacterium]
MILSPSEDSNLQKSKFDKKPHKSLLAHVICADACLESAYVEVLQGKKADLLLTDPPYCLLTRRRKHGDLRDPKGRKIDRAPVVRFDTVRDYTKFTKTWLPLAVKYIKTTSPLVIWTNFLGRAVIIKVASELGYNHLWGEFIWAKRTTKNTGSEQLLRVYETALVLGCQPSVSLSPTDHAQAWAVVAGYDDDGEATLYGNHPHHKPFSVLEPLLRNYSQPGDLILDPFAGSGSIAASACRLNRYAATIELENEWVDKVKLRLR